MKILEEEPPLADECKLPWLIDAFLYPISASGMINLAVFVILPEFISFLVFVLASILSPFLQSGTSYIMRFLTLPFYIVFGCYVVYYVAHCVIDSTKGHRRATDLPMANIFSAGDLIAQVILLLGIVAICFCPAAFYYIFTRRIDLWFWMLLALGSFFFPMCFLRGMMFDSFDALNPIEISRSILSTFLPYCGLVLFFMALGGFAVAVLLRLPLWDFLRMGIVFYLVFVLAHRSGWFYWWYKDKLDWGL
ncbi:MAG: hypothetical protein A2Z38_02975 [Planctomycetes bacterium RBG_19FT_COMBO_48_8]|nr:MAG: hypothetical protein A2Z38_02975 [Planctomycetes bacterium RBG_19FT_COMBO_48_8]